MSREELAAVGLRFLAIFMVIYLLRAFPYFVIYELQGWQLAWGIISATTMALLSAILWFFPRTISGILLPKRSTAANPPSFGWSTAQVSEVGMFLLGVFAIIQSLPEVVYWGTFLLARTGQANVAPLGPQVTAAIGRLFAELALGAWLMLGAAGIRGAVDLIRSRA